MRKICLRFLRSDITLGRDIVSSEWSSRGGGASLRCDSRPPFAGRGAVQLARSQAEGPAQTSCICSPLHRAARSSDATPRRLFGRAAARLSCAVCATRRSCVAYVCVASPRRSPAPPMHCRRSITNSFGTIAPGEDAPSAAAIGGKDNKQDPRKRVKGACRGVARGLATSVFNHPSVPRAGLIMMMLIGPVSHAV